MGSIWKLAGVDIYVDQYTETKSPMIAELNPIGSTDGTYHWIYEPDKLVEIGGIVIGSGRIGLLKPKVGSIVTLTSDLGNVGVLFKELKFDRQLVSCQMVDTTLPPTAPVYRVTITLKM